MKKSNTTDIRNAPLFAAFFIFVLLAALFGAITNGTVLILVTKAQAFLTGLAAIAAALIAYDAQTSNAREIRRKDDHERYQKRITHYIQIKAELSAALPSRIAVCKSLLKTHDIEDCLLIQKEILDQPFPSVMLAFKETGVFDNEIRDKIIESELSIRTAMVAAGSGTESALFSSSVGRHAWSVSVVAAIYAREEKILQLETLLDKEIKDISLAAEGVFPNYHSIIRPTLDALKVHKDRILSGVTFD